MKFMIVLSIAAALLAPGAAFARGNPRWESNRGNGPFLCDNGRSYELRGNTIYVDGIPARNFVSYELYGSADGSGISLRENGFVRGYCELANPPPPPPAPKRWDHYVRVCDPHCHWETREIR